MISVILFGFIPSAIKTPILARILYTLKFPRKLVCISREFPAISTQKFIPSKLFTIFLKRILALLSFP